MPVVLRQVRVKVVVDGPPRVVAHEGCRGGPQRTVPQHRRARCAHLRYELLQASCALDLSTAKRKQESERDKTQVSDAHEHKHEPVMVMEGQRDAVLEGIRAGDSTDGPVVVVVTYLFGCLPGVDGHEEYPHASGGN